MKIKVLIVAYLFTICTSKAQNTLSYTENEAIFNNAIELFGKKAYSASKKEFHNYIAKSEKSLNPNKFNIGNAQYYSALSSLYSNSKDADIEVARFVLNNPDHPKAKLIYSDLANSFFAKGDYKSAIEYYEKALENRQDNLDTYELRYQLAMSYYLINDFKRALREFDNVKATVAPNALNAAYYAAVINFKNEDFDLALSDLRRVENVNPYKIEVPNWIAQILYRQKKYDELLTYTEPIIANPNGRKIDELCLLTAEVHFFKDNYEKASTYYDKFKDFKRGNVSNQVNFRHAFSLFKVENFQKSAQLFRPLATENSELGQQSAYYLGISSLKTGDLNAALASFEAAKKLNFDKAIKEESIYNLVKVLIEKNNNQQAITELQDYLKTYPNGKYIDDSNELLSEILFETNNYVSAIQYIESLSRKTPKINEAYQKLCFNQGVVEFNLEKFESAIINFDKSTSQPVNKKMVTDAKFWKAEASYQLEKPETESLYRELLNSSDNAIKLKSTYSIGYLNFNSKNYSKSIEFFNLFLDNSKYETSLSHYREDALLRLADSYLVGKNYSQALKLYENAYNSNKTDKDYALYQKGLALKYLDRDEEARLAFDLFSKLFSNSRLIDDALYQNAVLEMDKSNYSAAINIFTDLLRKKPNSLLVPQVLLKRALCFSNLAQHDRAISDYKVIINKFGTSPYANEALLGIRESLNNDNRSEDFYNIAEDYKKNNPGANSVLNLQYGSAKDLYYSEKYDKAILALKNFIASNPKNSNIPEATYLIAESNYILGNKSEALIYYNDVVSNNYPDYITKAAYRAATLQFETQKYSDAINSYMSVLGSTSNKRDIVLAWEGLYKSHYFTGNYDKTLEYANKVISDGGNTVLGGQNTATLYLGKAFMQKKQFSEAKIEYEKTIALAKDINGAEAKYFIGDMQFKNKEYDSSIKTMQELAADFSDFVYWYEKGFMLIVDNYLGKGDNFMAKATLNSIIENSENKGTVEQAKAKLKTIK